MYRKIDWITTYHQVLKDLNIVLKKHIPILHANRRMADVLKQPPMAAFRRPRNLKDAVVRTKLENPLLQTKDDIHVLLAPISKNIGGNILS